MRKKAEEAIYDIFLWHEGSFEFVEGSCRTRRWCPSRSTSPASSWRGLRRYDEWKEIRERIPDCQRHSADRQALDLDDLSEREKLIVPYIDGIRRSRRSPCRRTTPSSPCPSSSSRVCGPAR